MPKRLIRRRYFPFLVMTLVILGSFVTTAWALHLRSSTLDDVIYQQCVANENQDAVIVAILNAIPPKRRSQVVNDAINALEPPGEVPCHPPKGAFP